MSILNTLALGAITAAQAAAPAQVATVHPAPAPSGVATGNFEIQYQAPSGQVFTQYTGASLSDSTGTFVTPFFLDYYFQGTSLDPQHEFFVSHKITIKPSSETDLLRVYPTKESEISLPRIQDFIDSQVNLKMNQYGYNGPASEWFGRTDSSTGIYSSGISNGAGVGKSTKFGNEIYGLAENGSGLQLEIDIKDHFYGITGNVEYDTALFYDVDSGKFLSTKNANPNTAPKDVHVTTVGHIVS